MSEESVELVTHLSEEDKQKISQAKSNLAFLKLAAEKAAVEAQAGELSLRNMVLTAFMKYGLGPADQIDNDGKIMRVSVTPVLEEEVKTPKRKGSKE